MIFCAAPHIAEPNVKIAIPMRMMGFLPKISANLPYTATKRQPARYRHFWGRAFRGVPAELRMKIADLHGATQAAMSRYALPTQLYAEAPPSSRIMVGKAVLTIV